MYLAMRTVIFISLVFFLLWGGYWSLFEGYFFLMYKENFELKKFLFGLSLTGISSIALFNFKHRKLLTSYIFSSLIIYMIIYFYILRMGKDAQLTFFDLIPLFGAFTIFYSLLVAHHTYDL